MSDRVYCEVCDASAPDWCLCSRDDRLDRAMGEGLAAKMNRALDDVNRAMSSRERGPSPMDLPSFENLRLRSMKRNFVTQPDGTRVAYEEDGDAS